MTDIRKERQSWTDIGYGKTVVDLYRVWKDSEGLISGMENSVGLISDMERQWLTVIGYGKVVVD